jgi:hypothetical protein
LIKAFFLRNKRTRRIGVCGDAPQCLALGNGLCNGVR